MRIRKRAVLDGARPAALEPAADAVAAIRRAEQSAAERLAAEQAEQGERMEARRRADALLEQASARAAELAEQHRKIVRAAAAAEAERELEAAAAEITRLQRAARDRHDLAVELAVRLVLSGEARCSSR
jgi:hypothetical protein